MPVVAVTSASPAMATSIPPRGLNGWVDLRIDCDGDYEFRIDGRGSFTGGGTADRGIWTFVDDPSPDITGATIIFYFTKSNMNFQNQSGPGWSNLVRTPASDGTAPVANYYAYTTTYNGTWTQYPAYDAWVADSDPYWREADISRCDDGICGYARRSLTVNGETVSFLRGPVCVGT